MKTIEEKKIKLIVVAVIGKLLLSVALLYFNGFPNKSIEAIVCSGDCPISYVPATINILEHGKFTIFDDLSNYAGRMPGYELLLAISTLFSPNSNVSFVFVLLIQVLLAGISTYHLAKIAYATFKSRTVFYLTYALYLVSTYVSLLDIKVLTESLAISLFIIGTSLLIDSRTKKSNWLFFGLGLLLLYCILLRQYILPFTLLWIFYIAYTNWQFVSLNKIFLRIFVMLLPLILFDSFWIYRNYQQQEKFIPLVDSLYAGYDYDSAKGQPFYFSSEKKATSNYVKSWGGDFIWWNPYAEVTAFFSSPTKSNNEQDKMLQSFPEYIYTSNLNIDSLKTIQEYFRGSSDLSKEEFVAKLERFENDFKQEKTLRYYFYAPLRLFYKFLFHSGTYNLFEKEFSKLNFIEKSIKLLYTALYLLVLILGLIGIFFLLKRPMNAEQLLLLANATYIIVLLPLVLRRIEFRHFAFSYPFFIVLVSFLIEKLISAIKTSKFVVKKA